MQESMKEWEKLVEEEYGSGFGMISQRLDERSSKNERRAKRFNNSIIYLFASFLIPDTGYKSKNFKEEMVKKVGEDASATLRAYKEELIEDSEFIPRKKYHFKFLKMLEERKIDTPTEKLIWISDLTTYYNAVSGEDRLSYKVLTGENLLTILEELLPSFFHAASHLLKGKELKRENEILKHWPEITYLLVDSQSHPYSVITHALFVESNSRDAEVAKYLLQQTPIEGYFSTTINPPSEKLLSQTEERVKRFPEVRGACELPVFSNKLDPPKFEKYTVDLIWYNLTHKLKGEKVEEYMEELKKKAKIHPDFLPVFSQIEEKVKDLARMVV